MITSDLAEFGVRERKLLIGLLSAWSYQGLPEGFYDDEVVPMMNKDSGHVFLTNSEYQACMLNGDNLEIWHYCVNCGNEGFKEDCPISEIGDWCSKCAPKDYDEFN